LHFSLVLKASILRILITNNTLAERAGSEMYVRDIALALTRRGYEIVVFSLVLGEVAEELSKASVRVIDDVKALDSLPDIIHGQHHIETCLASLRFPKVPVVYFCHGVLPWEEIPPKLPTIRHYVAVDDAVFDHLVQAHEIPSDRITRIYNFADLARFKPRSPLPESPENALVFSNYASGVTQLPAIEEACGDLGICLDVVGQASGKPCPEPEEILGNYDLVFAKARAAIEAMASGCAVILCDARGAGPLVTMENVSLLRPWNFGFRTLTLPLTAEYLKSQIRLIQSADAAAVSNWIRSHASMDQALTQIEATYGKVLEEHSLSPPIGEWELVTAVADYMLVPARRFKELTFGPSALPSEDGPDRRQVSHESSDLEPDPWLQVFADNGSGYNETDSMRQQIGRNKLFTRRFFQIEKLHRSGRFPIRIDPVNMPAILQIFKIRIVRDGDQALLYAAETKEDFGKLVLSEGLLSHLDEFGLLLLSPGRDPQIYLPLFGPLGDEPCTLEIVLQVHSTDLDLISLCHKLMEGDQESASPHPNLWLQVFADNGSGYNETDSMLQQIGGNKLSTLRFLHVEKLQRSDRAPLRIDPVNRPAILQIFKIRIVRNTDQSLLYAAETKEDLAKLVLSEGLLSHLDEFGLLLLSPGPDPQIYLPLFGPLGDEPCTLEIVVQVHSALGSRLGQARQATHTE
jgi:Glycosyltransferase Family 4